MAIQVTVNKNTSQQPMLQTGLTGGQSIKFIDAPRVYVKAAESTTAAPVLTSIGGKSNGVTPTGWTDLGVVEGKAKIGVEKKSKDVKTGIDQYYRGSYVSEKMGTLEFNLSQLDDVVFSQITGLTASVVTAGSVYSYPVGSEDLNVIAVLLVVQNKLDGKEWQFYNPAAYVDFAINDTGDELQLKATGKLPFFVPLISGWTKEAMLWQTIFA